MVGGTSPGNKGNNLTPEKLFSKTIISFVLVYKIFNTACQHVFCRGINLDQVSLYFFAPIEPNCLTIIVYNNNSVAPTFGKGGSKNFRHGIPFKFLVQNTLVP